MLKIVSAALAVLLVVVGGWRIWKSLFIELVTAGVNWVGLEEADRVNFVMSLALGVIGIVLSIVGVYLARLAVDIGQRANDLTAKATSIAEKQDKYLEEERAKRAVFQLSRPSIFSGDGRSFQLWLTNKGRRASRGYWYLGVPKRVSERVQVQLEPGFREIAVNSNYDVKDNQFDDPQFSHFHDDYLLRKFEATDEIGPSDRRLAGTVVVDWKEEDRVIFNHGFRWFTQTPDGRFPETGIKAMLLVRDSEHWIKYGTRDTESKVRAYLDNPEGDSWLTF